MLRGHKIVALFLVLTVVLTVVTMPVTFAADTQISPAEEKALSRLSALGILTGDEEGLRPESNVTRAEFAAIIVNTLGLNDGMEKNKDLPFDDIAKSWAVDAICLVAEMQYMSGVGGRRFNPDGDVTYEQAVKVVVSILGYKPVAEELGGYPMGYLTAAGKTLILRNVNGKSGVGITRGSLAVLLDNALETPMLVSVFMQNGETKYVQSGTGNAEKRTILEHSLQLQKVYGLVTAVRDNTRIITIRRSVNGNLGENVSYKVVQGVDILGLENLFVYLYLNSDDIVVGAVQTKGDNKVVFDFIDEVNGDNDRNGAYFPEALTQVKLINSGDVYDVNENEQTVIYFNGKLASNEAIRFAGSFCKIFINDDETIKMEVYTLSEGGIISQISDESLKYIKGNETFFLRAVESANNISVFIDGLASTYDMLELDMIFDYWYNDGMRDIVIVASSQYLEGCLTDISSESLIIDGTSSYVDTVYPLYYAVDGSQYESGDDVVSLLNQQVIAYRDGKGQVRYIKYIGEEMIASFFGVVMGASSLKSLKDEEQLKIFKINGFGEEKIYTVDLDKTSPITFAEAAQNAAKYDGSGIYKFTVNGVGEITSIETVEFTEITTTSFMNESPGRIRMPNTNNSRYLDSAFIVVLAEEDGLFKPKMISWDSHLRNRGATGVTVKIDQSEDDPCVHLVVLTSGWDTIYNGDPRYGLVTKNSSVSKDESILYKIILERASSKETYVFKDTKYITLNGFTAKTNSFMVYRPGYLYDTNGIGVLMLFDLSKVPEQWQTVPSGNGLRTGFVDAVKRNYIRMVGQSEFMGINSADLQVYQVIANDQFEKRMLADITAGMQIWYVYYNDAVRAIFYR